MIIKNSIPKTAFILIFTNKNISWKYQALLSLSKNLKLAIIIPYIRKKELSIFRAFTVIKQTLSFKAIE